MHCTDAVPPTAYMSLHDRLLTLHVQVTLFAQHHFNTGQSFCDLGHFQQFRQHLIEPAAIHTQRCSQNLVKPVSPPYYCGNIVVLFIVLYCITIAMVSHLTHPVAGSDDIVVLFIVLYCITIAMVSHLTHPVAGMTSHMTHCAAWLLSQVASLYSLLFSCSTLPLMRT